VDAGERMTRRLRVVDAAHPEDVFVALRDALTGGGDAVLPRAGESRAGESRAGKSRAGESNSDGGELVAQNVALVIETSGSTGVPKRVALSADALLASAAASAGALGGQGQWLLALPVHYVAGAQVLVRSRAAETEPLYYGTGHFDPERFAELAAGLHNGPRYTSLVPVQLARLLDAAESGSRRVADALRRFDGILVGGQALSPAIRERAELAGARVVATYGSSETAGGCVYDGTPIGTTVVREVEGHLEITGAVLAEGYLGDPERTAESFYERDGLRWYRTGDLGGVDPQGRVTVSGRADNVIISGGDKVLLNEVERVVKGVPGLEDAVVVAAGHPEWGQVPVVVVEGRTPAGLASIRRAVTEQLGRAAAPARLVEVPRMPRLSSGKPDRLALAEVARETEA